MNRFVQWVHHLLCQMNFQHFFGHFCSISAFIFVILSHLKPTFHITIPIIDILAEVTFANFTCYNYKKSLPLAPITILG